MIGLDVVHRFTDPTYAALSLAMRHGEDVFDQLWARGQIRLHASETERLLHAIGTETADYYATKNPGAGECTVRMPVRALVSVAACVVWR